MGGGDAKQLESGDDGEGDLMPADDILMRASRAMNPQKALPTPEIMDAEEVDEDSEDE
jgi:hypothetical protein